MEDISNNLPDTPQDFYDYFHWRTLYAKPADAKWSIGAKAAQMWVGYHSQENSGADPLVELVQLLMPYRYAGSGFLSLWQSLLRHVQTLSVTEQASIWRAVFNQHNQGNRLLPNSDRFNAIMSTWISTHASFNKGTISVTTLAPLVTAFGPTMSTTDDWLIFAYSIDIWIKGFLPSYSFVDELIEQHNAAVKQ